MILCMYMYSSMYIGWWVDVVCEEWILLCLTNWVKSWGISSTICIYTCVCMQVCVCENERTCAMFTHTHTINF